MLALQEGVCTEKKNLTPKVEEGSDHCKGECLKEVHLRAKLKLSSSQHIHFLSSFCDSLNPILIHHHMDETSVS